MDLDTLIVFGALISVLLAVVLALTVRSAPTGSRDSLSIWIAAVALMALYWPLFGLSERLESGYLHATVNTLVIAALLAHLCAVRSFVKRHLRHWFVLGAIMLALLANLWFTLVQDSLTARVVLVTCIAAGALLAIAWALRGDIGRHGGEARRFLQILAMIGAVLVLARMAAHFFAPAGDWSNWSRLAAILYLALFPVFASFAFILMHSDRANSELERLAGTDPLTGALNRRSLEKLANRLLSEARRHRRPTSVLMVDADHFKLVNDTYGHEAGDVVLCELLRRIEETLRLEDAVGRIGGEEFVVLLPGTPLSEALQAAERIRSRVGERNFIHHGEEIPLTVSIGVAERSPGEGVFEPLLKRADDAMYEAKRAGRNRVVTADSAIEASVA